jgi:hypothetical protein
LERENETSAAGFQFPPGPFMPIPMEI